MFMLLQPVQSSQQRDLHASPIGQTLARPNNQPLMKPQSMRNHNNSTLQMRCYNLLSQRWEVSSTPYDHDRGSDRAIGRTNDRASEQASDQANDRTSERATKRASERAIERARDLAAEQATERTREGAIERPLDMFCDHKICVVITRHDL